MFFPGSLPPYKDGVLVSGLGISGDGVDQDDCVTNAKRLEAPMAIRADQLEIKSVRLPYLKFPRNPTDRVASSGTGQQNRAWDQLGKT